jgi:hypothetical protein
MAQLALEAQKPITEAEMTLIRFLRRAGIPPEEALVRITGSDRERRG